MNDGMTADDDDGLCQSLHRSQSNRELVTSTIHAIGLKKKKFHLLTAKQLEIV